MMWQVGVERDAVAIEQLVALAVAVQNDGAALDQRGLAAARLVHRRIAGAAGDRPGRQRVARELGALAGQRRREDLVAVAGDARSVPCGARRARTTVTAPSSSRRSSCESRSSSPAAIRVATCSVGLVSPRSTCESIGALTPERSARSRSDRSIASRRARTRGPSPLPFALVCVAPLGDIRMYVITYTAAARLSG